MRGTLAGALILVGLVGAGSAGGHASRERALAYAHAVNLRPGDLPGLRPGTPERVDRAFKREARFAKCLGIPADERILTVLSPLLTQDELRPLALQPVVRAEAVSSRVGVTLGSLRSVRHLGSRATREAVLLASERGRGCLASLLRATLAPFHLDALTVTPRPDPLNGLDGAVAYRFAVAGTERRVIEPGGFSVEPAPCPPHRGETVPRHARIRCFPYRWFEDVAVLGHTPDATVELYAGGGRPFPLSTERRLLMLLVARAARATL